MSNDQKEEKLIKEVSTLFINVGIGSIDETIIGKIRLAIEKEKAKKRDELKRLFESQIQTLNDRGCPKEIIGFFVEQKDLVVSRATEMTMTFKENWCVPFLPVIPLTYRSLYDLAAMVWNGGKNGHILLESINITDYVETPKKPYYIYGVTLLSVVDFKERQSRLYLTAAEILAFAAHTDVLLQSPLIYANCSTCCDALPVLYLNPIGSPEFSFTRDVSADLRRHPCCISRG